MKKRPVLLIIILLLVVSCVVILVRLREKEPLAKSIEDELNYTIISCIDENGEIEIVVDFHPQPDPELYAQYCARVILSSVKRFPRQASAFPEEVTVRLYVKDTRQTILRVSVKGARLLETSWDKLLEDQIPSHVDYYYFNDQVFK